METFIVRLWTPASGSAPAGGPLRGVVEHVESGASSTFTSEDEISSFMRDAAGTRANDATSRDRATDGDAG